MNLQEKYPWMELVTPEDLPTDDLKIMADIIGMPTTIKLLTEAPGCIFTMTTTWDRREVIKRYIKALMTALSYAECVYVCSVKLMRIIFIKFAVKRKNKFLLQKNNFIILFYLYL